MKIQTQAIAILLNDLIHTENKFKQSEATSIVVSLYLKKAIKRARIEKNNI